jgi:hypothetical protein
VLSQGDQGEYAAIAWLGSTFRNVAIPVGNCPDYDVVANLDGRLVKVQVKTTRRRVGERFSVTLCTRGGNRSWSGVVKRLDPSRFECLFVHVGDGRRWFVPSGDLDGGSSILLGGPKYARFEVEPGAPLPSVTDALAEAL